MRRRLWCLTGVITTVILLGASAPCYAQDIPPLPHAFYGVIRINGQPAAVGTAVEARGQGVVSGVAGNPLITSEIGQYGTPGAMGSKLVVQGNITDGSLLEFYINAFKADKTFLFSSGEVTGLDLAATIPQYGCNTAVTPSGSGTVSLSPVQPAGGYTAGTTVTLTAAPGTGYVFASWSGDLTGSANPAVFTINASKSITAVFNVVAAGGAAGGESGVPVRYTITAGTIPSGAGTVSLSPVPPNGGYPAGTVVTVAASAATGYTFTNWSGDLSGSANPVAITMNANKNITVNFERTITLPLPQYNLVTFSSPPAGGSVTASPVPETGGYTAGTVVMLSATASTGYTFTGWGGDLSGSINPAPITMNSNKNITAIYAASTPSPAAKYNLIVNTNPVAGGTVRLNPVQPADGYSAGTVVTLEATANNGFIFTGWSGDLSGNANQVTFMLNSAKSVTAHFSAPPPSTNWLLWAGLAGGIVIIAGLLIYFLVMRRAIL